MTDAPINHPDGSARPLSSTKARMAMFAGLGILGLFVAVRVFSPKGEENKPVKSKAEGDLEKILEGSKKAGNDGRSKVTSGKGSDQPTGDPEALAALTEVEAKQAVEAKNKKAAEDQVLAQLAYQHYTRKLQGLTYDQALAADWEARIQAAQSTGQAPPPPPGTVSQDALDTLKKSRPDLYAKWTASQGAKGQAPSLPKPGPAAPAAPQIAKGGAGVAIPAGIDPKTGLPLQGGAMAHSSGVPDEVIYALSDDGVPDIAHGAVPVTITFTPPGSQQPVTQTRWVRPGYLTGRARPLDPKALLEEDEAYRRALRESSEVPDEPGVSNVAIPYRYTNSITTVDPANDFHHVNRYVVVLPNPNGKLTPSNPPAPARGQRPQAPPKTPQTTEKR